MKCFDIAVIGLGAMGSFTACELARRKVSVIGFDRLSPPHEEGSHGGETRTFRTVYKEHPNYVPLMRRSLELWDRLGQERGVVLLTRSGLINMGVPKCSLIEGIQQSATIHNLRVERLSAAEVCQRFPALRPPEDFIGLIDDQAGWIDVPAALGCALEQARSFGAHLKLDQPALEWSIKGGEVVIETLQESFRAKQIVITAGVLAGELLATLKLPLLVRRQVLTWFKPYKPELFDPRALKPFAFSQQGLYGFPNIKGQGVKIAYHERGDPLPDYPVKVPPVAEADFIPLVDDVTRFLPELINPDIDPMNQILAAKTCLYMMTPDGHFIIDRHPEHQQVCFAAGFSGHGFKFAPLVGEVLSDLALEGKTALPVEFLRLKGRF